VCDGQAFGYKAGTSKLIATMSATMMAIFEREGIHH
jgi:hypothetical protein